MTLALPGQVLLEGIQGFGPELVQRDDQSALLPQQPSRVEGQPPDEAVEVLQLGKFPIKACWLQGLSLYATLPCARGQNCKVAVAVAKCNTHLCFTKACRCFLPMSPSEIASALVYPHTVISKGARACS